MRLYSLQHPDAWDVAQKKGFFSGNHGFRGFDENSEFGKAYVWMQDQMKKRLKNFSGDYPVWAWPCKMDLRFWVWCIEEPCLVIVMEVPPERVLLSDLAGFLFVIDNHYSAWTEEEYEKVYSRGEPSQQQIEKSWERIFELDSPQRRHRDAVVWGGKLDEPRDIQACIDRVYVNEVISTRLIKPHSRRKSA